MCGILGFNWKDEELAASLAKSIEHRGPDSSGFYCDENLSLGQQRLSIIDLSPAGNQPMISEDENYYIIYNGEIFNFRVLRRELEKKGYKFFSNCDTEIVLKSYMEYGKKALQKLNGQFAFCIYDKKQQTLFLARDRIGILPLYYYFDGKRFIFGSELKVILGSGIKKSINKDSMYYYFLYGHTPAGRSIIEDAYKLLPGHYLIFDLKKSRIIENERYWNINFSQEISDESIAKKQLLEKLDNSVKSRMIADVHVGAFLSGGLDSSLVTAIASKYSRHINTFSVRFDKDDFDESGYSRLVAKKLGTKHHIVEFSAKDVIKLIPELVYHYDEPFGDPSMVPMYLVSRVAAQSVKVALSGDGGDELFGGYSSYSHLASLNFQYYYPNFINRILLNLPVGEKYKTYLEIGCQKYKYPALMGLLKPSDFKKMTGKSPESYYMEYSKKKIIKTLNQAIGNDLQNYLSADILAKVDRATLGNSLESRPPILDHEIIEFSCRLSQNLKKKGKIGKYILKKTAEGILPKEIIYRKKMGFGVPLKHYLNNELNPLIQKHIIDFKGHSYINKAFVKSIKRDNGRDFSKVIWSIIMFNLWWDRWMG